MKTITTLIAIAAASFALNANAEFTDTEYLTIGEVFPIQNSAVQEQQVTFIEDTSELNNNLAVHGDPGIGDVFPIRNTYSIARQSVARALLELELNPPAAGKSTDEVFIWNEMDGDYHLQ